MADVRFIGSNALKKAVATLAEGPLWNAREQALYWIDTIGKKMFRYDPATDVVADRSLIYRPSALASFPGGGLLLALKKGVALYRFETGEMRSLQLDGLDFKEAVFNDGACDPAGRFWIGSRDKNVKNPVGQLYRIDADYGVTVMSGSFTCSNGIAWSLDRRTLYHVDTYPGLIYAYDFDPATGAVADRKVHIDYQGATWHPDGCTVDAEGGLWVAEVEGSRLARYAPDGALDRVVDVPVSKPTSMAFGGPDLSTMFVTSMRYGLSEQSLADQPLAGTVMMLDVGVKGLAEPDFAGSWGTAPVFVSDEDRRRLAAQRAAQGGRS